MLKALMTAVMAVSLITPVAASGGCVPSTSSAGLCTSNSGGGVVVEGHQNQGGSQGSSDDHRSSNDGNAAPAPKPSATCAPTDSICRRSEQKYDVVLIRDAIPPIALSDLVSFVPTKPSLTGEPTGIGVVGMPTNVVASASVQDIPGRLFGQYDVTVRFVPAGFRFTYGDGSTISTTTGGARWTALGQADFTPTATSHVYRERGTYPVSATVLYSASVGFGGATWLPVDGYIEATTSGYSIRIVEVHTALVDQTCLENPTGPGC